MSLTDLALVILATCGITELARHATFVQHFRARIESMESSPAWLRTLLACGFCLSHWCAILAVVLLFCGGPIGYALLVGFAAVRGANLINDVMKRFNRSPKLYEWDKPRD